MKSIVVTYPDFQSLPKGIKRMLVASEDHFFSEAKPGARVLNEVEGKDLLATTRFVPASRGLDWSWSHVLDELNATSSLPKAGLHRFPARL